MTKPNKSPIKRDQLSPSSSNKQSSLASKKNNVTQQTSSSNSNSGSEDNTVSKIRSTRGNRTSVEFPPASPTNPKSPNPISKTKLTTIPSTGHSSTKNASSLVTTTSTTPISSNMITTNGANNNNNNKMVGKRGRPFKKSTINRKLRLELLKKKENGNGNGTSEEENNDTTGDEEEEDEDNHEEEVVVVDEEEQENEDDKNTHLEPMKVDNSNHKPKKVEEQKHDEEEEEPKSNAPSFSMKDISKQLLVISSEVQDEEEYKKIIGDSESVVIILPDENKTEESGSIPTVSVPAPSSTNSTLALLRGIQQPHHQATTTNTNTASHQHQHHHHHASSHLHLPNERQYSQRYRYLKRNEEVLHKPSYREFDDDNQSMPYQKPANYIIYKEKTTEEQDQLVEYDMDSEDEEWLGEFNKSSNIKYTDDDFEMVMDRLEKETFEYKQSIGSDMFPHFSSAEAEDVCSVCFDGASDDTNQIVYCDGCDIAVHQECYGILLIPEGHWFCQKCESPLRETISCTLCKQSNGALKQTVDGDWSHLVCILHMPEINRLANLGYGRDKIGPSGLFLKIPKQRYKLRCSVCRQKGGACIQCRERNCAVAFHPYCIKRKQKSKHLENPTPHIIFCKKHFNKIHKTKDNPETIKDKSKNKSKEESEEEEEVNESEEEEEESEEEEEEEEESEEEDEDYEEEEESEDEEEVKKKRKTTPAKKPVAKKKVKISKPKPKKKLNGKKKATKGKQNQTIVSLTSSEKTTGITAKKAGLISLKKALSLIKFSPIFVKSVYEFWVKKRLSRSGMPLIKRFQPSILYSLRSTLGSQDKGENTLLHFKYLIHLRKDLEKARTIMDILRKREKIKRDYWINLKHVFDLFVNNLYFQYQSIVDILLEMEIFLPFAYPVTEQQAPTYFAVIKKPMSLFNICEKLKLYLYDDEEKNNNLMDIDKTNTNVHSTNNNNNNNNENNNNIDSINQETKLNSKEFWEDLRLIYTNAQKFNNPKTSIYKSSKLLEDIINDLYQRYHPTEDDNEPTDIIYSKSQLEDFINLKMSTSLYRDHHHTTPSTTTTTTSTTPTTQPANTTSTTTPSTPQATKTKRGTPSTAAIVTPLSPTFKSQRLQSKSGFSPPLQPTAPKPFKPLSLLKRIRLAKRLNQSSQPVQSSPTPPNTTTTTTTTTTTSTTGSIPKLRNRGGATVSIDSTPTNIKSSPVKALQANISPSKLIKPSPPKRKSGVAGLLQQSSILSFCNIEKDSKQGLTSQLESLSTRHVDTSSQTRSPVSSPLKRTSTPNSPSSSVSNTTSTTSTTTTSTTTTTTGKKRFGEKELQSVLAEISSQDTSGFFKVRGRECTHYEPPKHLDHIQERIKNGIYTNYNQFFTDVFKVVEHPHRKLGKVGKELTAVAEELKNKYL